MFSSADIIDLAIQIEKNGEKVYRDALGGVKDQSVVSNALLLLGLRVLCVQTPRQEHYLETVLGNFPADEG
ncbi:MAG: hypothetical protein JSV40_07170, partial [Deltaproteobacteria bacterium]